MLHDFLAALALVLVIEGIMPFLSPEWTRKTMEIMARRPNGTLRLVGLTSMLLGVVGLYLLK
uniref:DUF2065 domain-containing protein n=1 Tax=Candidatus Kentrum sp. DK TaxID=2126562 RepID=A0A450RTT2_9GAMM|nr:MAG: hypothetical protein BECKDK2373B_GA0170837_100178 [Candidatus Kentron sp. DK]VFJ48125.1 MAG: hypothetical protein BECKDK2373C_GA0170839_102018 [Candidatus Kentron sp. DK]